MTYAKLTDNKLEVLTRLPTCGNPTAEMLATYAAANGYKTYVRVAKPDGYHRHSYHETAKQIKDVWTPYTDSEQAPIRAQEAHAYLTSTDWVAAKLAEVDGEERAAMKEHYADVLAKRREARETINKYEN